MDMDMSIAALSIGLNQGKVQQQFGVSVLKMQMDTGQAFIRAISALYSTAVILTNISCSRRHHGMIC